MESDQRDNRSLIIDHFNEEKQQTNIKPLDDHEVKVTKPLVPLNTSWTFYLDKSTTGISAEEFEASIVKIYTVESVQAFWSVFNHIKDVRQLKEKHTYHLMRGTRRPMWEDELNRNGGNWRLKCHHNDTGKIWKELLVAAIGEQLTSYIHPDDEIGGLSVSPRDHDDVIQIWNSRADLHSKSTIEQQIRILLPRAHIIAMFYKPFSTHQAFSATKSSVK